MDFIFKIIFCALSVPCKPKYCKVCCVTGSVLVFCAEFCPWMTDMKEVKEEEGLLEKEGFSFGPADKTDVELQTHWYFFARKSQK